MRFNKTFLLTIFVAIGMTFSIQVIAQTTGITIAPLTFELVAKPGDILTNTIKVYNPADNVISIKMSAEDFRVIGESGQVIVEPQEDTTYSFKKWVKIEPTEFTLKSKEQKFVNFTINIPKNAEPGGKYGSVLATTNVSGAEQKVGSLVLLTVSGEIKESLILKEFSISKSSKSVSFKVRLENNGTVHLRPRGSIIIENCQGKKIEDLEIPATNILPGAIRETDVSWTIKSEGNCYNAYLVGVYGSESKPFSSEKINFQIPPTISLNFYQDSRFFFGILIILFRTINLWPF